MKRKVDIDKLLEQVKDYRIEYWDGAILHKSDDVVARGEGRAFDKFDEAWLACHADRLDNVSSMVLSCESMNVLEYRVEVLW